MRSLSDIYSTVCWIESLTI